MNILHHISLYFTFLHMFSCQLMSSHMSMKPHQQAAEVEDFSLNLCGGTFHLAHLSSVVVGGSVCTPSGVPCASRHQHLSGAVSLPECHVGAIGYIRSCCISWKTLWQTFCIVTNPSILSFCEFSPRPGGASYGSLPQKGSWKTRRPRSSIFLIFIQVTPSTKAAKAKTWNFTANFSKTKELQLPHSPCKNVVFCKYKKMHYFQGPHRHVSGQKWLWR